MCHVSPGAITDQHVAKVTLVLHHGLVAHRGVDGLAVVGIVRDVALYRDAGGQLATGPRPVRLTDPGGPPHHLEARLAVVHRLAPEGGAAARHQAVQDVLGRPAVDGQTGEVGTKPRGRPIDEETLRHSKTLKSLTSVHCESPPVPLTCSL